VNRDEALQLFRELDILKFELGKQISDRLEEVSVQTATQTQYSLQEFKAQLL
jgi:hypothetical protein